MSFKASQYYLHESDLRGTMKLAMMSLADYANDQGVAMPGIERVASDVNYCERWVQKILQKLVQNGELVICYQQGLETGHGKTNCYQLVRYRAFIGLETDGVNTEDTPRGEHGVHPNYQENRQSTDTSSTFHSEEESHAHGREVDVDGDRLHQEELFVEDEDQRQETDDEPATPSDFAVADFTKPNPHKFGTKAWGDWENAKHKHAFDNRMKVVKNKTTQQRSKGPMIDEDGNEISAPSAPRTKAETWFIKWLRDEGYNVSTTGLNPEARKKFEQRVAVQMVPKVKYRPSIPELFDQQGGMFEEWLTYTLNGWKTALKGKKSRVVNAITYIHNQYLSYDDFARQNNTEWWNQKPIEEKEAQ